MDTSRVLRWGRGLSTGRVWAPGKKRVVSFNVLGRREAEKGESVYLVVQS